MNIQRLRWIIPIVIGFDFAFTMIGQPRSYWSDPKTANELNAFFAYFMHKGIVAIIPVVILYAAGVFWYVSVIPKKARLFVILAFTLAHFNGASGWILYKFRLGMFGLISYSFLILL